MALALVKYAGYEQEPEPGERRVLTPEQKADRLLRKRWRLANRAYTMFRAGQDTAQIAAALDRKESTVLKWINTVRSHKRKLPVPYEAKRQ